MISSKTRSKNVAALSIAVVVLYSFTAVLFRGPWDDSSSMEATDLVGRLLSQHPYLNYKGFVPQTRRQVGDDTVFFMGIFSTRGEFGMRRVVRSTMLGVGRDRRVCSVHDYMSKKAKGEPHTCQIVYAFILGANDEGPTDYDYDSSEPIVVEGETVAVARDDRRISDLVFLNIKENMEDGKTPTFFKYASMIVDEYGIDYVAKTDMDTLIGTSKFIDFVRRDLPPKPKRGVDRRRMYGGLMIDYHLCGGEFGYPYCKLLVGKGYMAGQFYFLSSDLVKYVSSDDLDRSSMRIGIEDYDMGTWVMSNPKPVKLVVMSRELLWIHDADTKSRRGWRIYVDEAYEKRLLPQTYYALSHLDDCLYTWGENARMWRFECVAGQ